MPKVLLGAVFALTSIVLAGSGTCGAQSAVRVQSPCVDEATAATVDLLAARFDDHQFVFIGSTHGDLKIEEFLVCLVSRPSFTQRVTDIVEEQISSGHQTLLDRYLLGLEQIPPDILTSIWFDTDAPTLWTTLPQVRRFLETLRDVNRTLPPARRIRLVGGNEGIDWARVQAPEDLAPYPYKTNLVPHLLVEHLARTPGNRTLVVYGDCHIHYNGNNFMRDLEAALGRTKLFVVGRIGELVPTERAFLAAVGNAERPFFQAADRFPANLDGPPSLRVCTGEESGRLADYIDGFVYLGPEPDPSLIGSVPLTLSQQSELERRTSILADPQRTMRARLRGRDQWFATHPDDFAPRPPAFRAAGPVIADAPPIKPMKLTIAYGARSLSAGRCTALKARAGGGHMQTRATVALIGFLCMIAGPAQSHTIGLYADPGGTRCTISGALAMTYVYVIHS